MLVQKTREQKKYLLAGTDQRQKSRCADVRNHWVRNFAELRAAAFARFLQ
jgi:hypothetical protein